MSLSGLSDWQINIILPLIDYFTVVVPIKTVHVLIFFKLSVPKICTITHLKTDPASSKINGSLAIDFKSWRVRGLETKTFVLLIGQTHMNYIGRQTIYNLGSTKKWWSFPPASSIFQMFGKKTRTDILHLKGQIEIANHSVKFKYWSLKGSPHKQVTAKSRLSSTLLQPQPLCSQFLCICHIHLQKKILLTEVVQKSIK